MVPTKRGRDQPWKRPEPSSYEKLRNERIKENKERMQNLGIYDLALKMIKPNKTLSTVSTFDKPLLPSLPFHVSSPRRSTRLKTLNPINYCDKQEKSKTEYLKRIKIQLKEEWKPEVYTEEHEKLLGDCKTAWTLPHAYRPFLTENGEMCHQCKYKCIGLHSRCSKCNSGQGQLCGYCLYTRYGENVVEVNQNSNWICPVCRDICNCSLCRRSKGWQPTGCIYKMVKKQGFKSVAHFLIQTRQCKNLTESSATGSSDSEENTYIPTNKDSSPFIQGESLNVIVTGHSDADEIEEGNAS